MRLLCDVLVGEPRRAGIPPGGGPGYYGVLPQATASHRQRVGIQALVDAVYGGP